MEPFALAVLTVLPHVRMVIHHSLPTCSRGSSSLERSLDDSSRLPQRASEHGRSPVGPALPRTHPYPIFFSRHC